MPEGPVLTGFWGPVLSVLLLGSKLCSSPWVGGLGRSAMVSIGRHLLVLACQFWKRVKQS